MTSTPTRQLPVDLEELSLAFEAEASDVRWYLDAQTGSVILVTAEFDPGEHGVTREQLETDALRFVPVPPVDPQHIVEDMSAYASTVADAQLRESLQLALSAPRPEKRFKTALSWLPEHQTRWHAWRQERCGQRMNEWLARNGLVPQTRSA